MQSIGTSTTYWQSITILDVIQTYNDKDLDKKFLKFESTKKCLSLINQEFADL